MNKDKIFGVAWTAVSCAFWLTVVSIIAGCVTQGTGFVTNSAAWKLVTWMPWWYDIIAAIAFVVLSCASICEGSDPNDNNEHYWRIGIANYLVNEIWVCVIAGIAWPIALVCFLVWMVVDIIGTRNQPVGG